MSYYLYNIDKNLNKNRIIIYNDFIHAFADAFVPCDTKCLALCICYQ